MCSAGTILLTIQYLAEAERVRSVIMCLGDGRTYTSFQR